MSTWKEYAQLDRRLREIERESKEIQAQMKELEPILLEEMEDMGIQKMSINGITYYPHRRVFAGVAPTATKDSVSEALIECGMSDYVSRTYNTNTLSSWVRDLARSHSEDGDINDFSCDQIEELLPAPLKGKLKVGEQWGIASQKS